MEEEYTQSNTQSAETKQEGYTPRPSWQVWAARIGLVIVIIAVILYYFQIAGGGR